MTTDILIALTLLAVFIVAVAGSTLGLALGRRQARPECTCGRPRAEP